MGHAARFWDWIADRYARQPVADAAAYEHKLAVTREYLRPDMEVLEFGCGTGTTALEHAAFVRRIHAIDVSARMVAIARDKAEHAGVANVDFEQAAFDDCAGADRTWDAVLGLNVMHLLDDPDGAPGRIHRMLKPGGVFVTSTPCIGDMGIGLRLLAGALRLLPFLPAVRVFGEDEFVRALEAAGLCIVHRWRPGPGKATFIVARRPA